MNFSIYYRLSKPFLFVIGKKRLKKRREKLIQKRDKLVPKDPNEYLSPFEKREIDYLNARISSIDDILKKD